MELSDSPVTASSAVRTGMRAKRQSKENATGQGVISTIRSNYFLADIKHDLADMQALLHPLMRAPGVFERVDHADDGSDAMPNCNFDAYWIGKKKSALP
jgi:hypothetical protein